MIYILWFRFFHTDQNLLERDINPESIHKDIFFSWKDCDKAELKLRQLLE